jgi:hypothetical protein
MVKKFCLICLGLVTVIFATSFIIFDHWLAGAIGIILFIILCIWGEQIQEYMHRALAVFVVIWLLVWLLTGTRL